MSIQRMYSIYDRKALFYQAPWSALTDGAAVRLLSDAVADPQSNISRHPNDYVLFHVGDWDDQKGTFVPLAAIAHVIDASALVKALQSEIPFPEGVTHQVRSSNGQAQVED